MKKSISLLIVLFHILTPLCVLGNDKEKIRLRVWGMREGEGVIGVQAALDAFVEKHPNIEIIQSVLGGDMNAQKLMCAIAGGDPPDVIHTDRFTVGGWAYMGAFTALDDFLVHNNLTHKIDPEEFYPACWQETIYNGNSYAIPSGTDARALYYNKKLLREAGYVDQNGDVVPPSSWTELKEYALNLTKVDEKGEITQVGFIPMFGNSWLYLYGWSNGGRFLSSDGGTCTLNDPKILEALKWLKDLYDSLGGVEKIQSFASSFQGGIHDPFLAGKVAMKIDGNWFLGDIARFMPDMDFGVAPAPVPKDMPKITWSGGYCYAIPVGAKYPLEAWEFLKWMNSLESYMIINKVQGNFNKSVGKISMPDTFFSSANRKNNEAIYKHFIEDNAALSENLKKGWKAFMDLMPYSKYRPVTPVGQILWDEHVRAVDFTLYNKKTPEEALNIGTHRVQSALDRMVKDENLKRFSLKYIVYLVVFVLLVLISYIVKKATGVASRMGRSKRYEHVSGILFALPAMAGFLIFVAGPMIASFIFSFCNYSVIKEPGFVGFENYIDMFTRDPVFWKSLWNTSYMVLFVPVNMAIGLIIALLLNTKVKGMPIYRTIFYLPAILPAITISFMWIWLLNPQIGMINKFIRFLGITPPTWLQSPLWSKPAFVVMGLWGAGAGMLIWLAGLKSVPESSYEAAAIDGANPWQQFWRITFPLLTPYTFFNIVMGTIVTFQIFTQAYIMTGGGPVDSTLFYAYYLFNNAFQYFKMGYASAIAWILFIIVMVMTFIHLKVAPRWVYYEAETSANR